MKQPAEKKRVELSWETTHDMTLFFNTFMNVSTSSSSEFISNGVPMIPAYDPGQHLPLDFFNLIQVVTHVRKKYIQPSVLLYGCLADVLNGVLVTSISLKEGQLVRI